MLTQTDNGSVDNANSYAEAADFRTYFADRGVDVDVYSDAQVEAALVIATEYLDSRFNFVGVKTRFGQRTAWPRTSAYDSDDLLRSGIPVEVKEAAYEYARAQLAGELEPAPDRDSTGRSVQSKSSTVGPISESITYASGAVYTRPRYPAADNRLRSLVEDSGMIYRA